MERGDPPVSAIAERLPTLLPAVLATASVTLGTWTVAPLYGGATAGSRPLYLLSGQARVGADERPWQLVLKTLSPAADTTDPAGSRYWLRERQLYASGRLDDLAVGLAAPRHYGSDEQPDGSVWLWLEYITPSSSAPWPLERWALAARQFGRLNGRHPVAPDQPSPPWLRGQRLRRWLEQYPRLIAQISAAPDSPNPAVRRYWPPAIVAAINQLWSERAAFCDALERRPQHFGHGDVIRRNLFARRGPDGEEQTVAIDWEYAGQMALGEEVGQTLSVASAFYDLEPAELPALDEALFTSYLAGLGDVGWRGDERAVRFAYTAHAALRNLFNAVGTVEPPAERRPAIQQNYGHSWEELAERRAAIRPFLLQCAAEARSLLAQH